MDPNGRLHMPNGFVGESFDETGVAEEKASQKRIADLFPVMDQMKKERARLLEKISAIKE